MFDRLWRIQTGLAVRLFTEHFGGPDKLSVADIGCMDGRAEVELAGRFARLTASDLLEENLLKARARGLSGVEWKLQPPLGNPLRLDFADNEFDALTAFSLFHHYDPDGRRQTLAEFRRIVRPGGMALVFEANPYCPAVPLWFAVQSHLEGEPLRLITLKTLRSEAASAGWQCGEAFVLRLPLPESKAALNVKYLPDFIGAGGPKYALALHKTETGD